MSGTTKSQIPLVAEGVTDPRAIAAAQKYDERLSEIGRLIRLEPYRNTETPILHRCLKHGMESEVRPANALKGRGMLCCKDELQKADARRRSQEAADRYDEILASYGRLKRLEAYTGNHVPILHLCLKHNERHKTAPSRTIKGGGLICCRQHAVQEAATRSIDKAAEEYDQKIAKIGKLQRIATYQGTKVPILHRCIAHGETGLIRPGNALSGYGLKCCRIASVRETGRQLRQDAAEKYDSRIAEFEKLLRLQDYVDSNTPILHRCLVHGEEALKAPSSALLGQGLDCCRRAANAKRIEEMRQKAAREYDAKIAEIGKVIRLEPYILSGTPILHRCLSHGEEQKSTPDTILAGSGLACCLLEARRATQRRRNREAADRYDGRLALIGRLVRVDPYINNSTPILHRCLDHDEVHPIPPNNALQGAGIKCCRRGGWDCLQSLLTGNDLRLVMNEPTFVYIFDVPGIAGWVKPGISNNPKLRSRNPMSEGIYGELLASWELPDRTSAILIEEAVLRDPAIPKPDDLGELFDAHGSKEIRVIEQTDLINRIQFLVDSLLEHDGPWQAWALHYIPMLSRWESRLLSQQSDCTI